MSEEKERVKVNCSVLASMLLAESMRALAKFDFVRSMAKTTLASKLLQWAQDDSISARALDRLYLIASTGLDCEEVLDE